jgi:uncharacterized membrane protein YeiB
MPIERSLPARAALGPVTQRVALLNVLRGFALLGAAHSAAYSR